MAPNKTTYQRWRDDHDTWDIQHPRNRQWGHATVPQTPPNARRATLEIGETLKMCRCGHSEMVCENGKCLSPGCNGPHVG